MKISKYNFCLFALLCLTLQGAMLPGICAETGATLQHVQLPGVGIISVEVCGPGVFHLQRKSGRAGADNLMERYNILPVRTSQSVSTFERGLNGVVVTSEDGSLEFDERTGQVSLWGKNRHAISPSLRLMPDRTSDSERKSIEQREKSVSETFQLTENTGGILGDLNRDPNKPTDSADELQAGHGFSITAALMPGERFYGLGTPSKSHIQLRGEAYYNWVRYTQDEQPVPFLMSTNGWGIFVNTAWRNYVDVGKTDPNQLLIWAPEGDLDIYLIVGAGMPQILDRYTRITGRPMLLPMWAYGLTWINHIDANQSDVLENARLFRESHFPVDGFGLEPGWMKTPYDFSTKVEWNVSRFFEPLWLRGSKRSTETFIGALKRFGIKLHLWLCVDYDLTGEAERQVAEKAHLTPPLGPEAYFNHLKPFLDDGVVAWKLDPARLVDTPDVNRKYANGHSEFEMHNLNQALLVKQIYEGQASYTGIRPMIQYCGGWAGTQQYAAQTVGDIEGGPEGLTWMLNANMSGYMNTAADMRVYSYNGEQNWPDGAGIHLGFLSPWTLIDGWAFPYQPWYAGPKLKAIMTDYARLRYRLLPYIYSMAHNGYQTGMPIMRPLPLMYPDDPRLQDETHEYMLGDWLLVTAFTPTVRLPAGKWIDYWTGMKYEGSSEMAYTPPANRGGGLFVREGAILPYVVPMNYVGEQSMEAVDLDIYPAGNSSLSLYEDDGLGFGYQRGESATTVISSSVTGDTVLIKIGLRTGHYEGMPSHRTIRLIIHRGRPLLITVDSKRIREGATGWTYDKSLKEVLVVMEGSAASNSEHQVKLSGVSAGRSN